jgi:redox-sensitive bicupin YhaK (pirin superfamily)
VVSGAIRVDGQQHGPGELPVFASGVSMRIQAIGDTRVMLLGGARVPEPREIFWNFVSSRPERIAQAKTDWTAARFAKVPGETEFIPLPPG